MKDCSQSAQNWKIKASSRQSPLCSACKLDFHAYIYMMYVGTKRMNQILEVRVVMPYHMFDWEHRDHKANKV